MAKLDVLIIEDEADIRHMIEGILHDEGYTTRSAANGIAGLNLLQERCPNVVILDVWLGMDGRDGISILSDIKRQRPFLPVIMISGHSTIEKAVESIHKGAYDFLEKPFQIDRLLLVVHRALESLRLQHIVNERDNLDPAQVVLIGSSKHAQQLRKAVHTHAESDTRIIFTGSVGSGKDYLARMIHNKSVRGAHAFTRINVSGVGLNDLKREMFGLDVCTNYTTVSQEIGWLERANLSTVYIDEIADMPKSIQKQLLDFMVLGYFNRLGGKHQVTSNVRFFVGTTHAQNCLPQHVREDFLAHIKIDHVHSVDLQERHEDIEPMIMFLIKNRCAHLGIAPKTIGQDALDMLHHWKSNIHQLQVAIEWMILQSGETMTADSLPRDSISENINMSWMNLPIKQAREKFEQEYFQYHLSRHRSNINEVSRCVGMERTAVYRKIQALHLR